jgi:hypothetical protein
MMRSESTSAFGQPRDTKEILGAGAFMRKAVSAAAPRRGRLQGLGLEVR